LGLTRAEEKLLNDDQRDEHILKHASINYDDLTNWERIYEYIDEKITSDLSTIFSKRFFLFPLIVNSNHWILMVASIETKEVFIVDSKNSTGRLSSYSYLVSILLKYFKYKSTLPGCGFVFNESEWSIKSLPCAEQKDGSSCGIFTFLNAAKLMKQIYLDPNVKISCVESPLREYTSSELVHLRKTVKEVLFNRTSIDYLVHQLHAKDLDLGIAKVTKASSPKSKVKNSKVIYEE
jgi:Ulp1 family protease